MVSALDSGSSGPCLSPGWGGGGGGGGIVSVAFWSKLDTLLLNCLSPPRCINGYH